MKNEGKKKRIKTRERAQRIETLLLKKGTEKQRQSHGGRMGYKSRIESQKKCVIVRRGDENRDGTSKLNFSARKDRGDSRKKTETLSDHFEEKGKKGSRQRLTGETERALQSRSVCSGERGRRGIDLTPKTENAGAEPRGEAFTEKIKEGTANVNRRPERGTIPKERDTKEKGEKVRCIRLHSQHHEVQGGKVGRRRGSFPRSDARSKRASDVEQGNPGGEISEKGRLKGEEVVKEEKKGKTSGWFNQGKRNFHVKKGGDEEMQTRRRVDFREAKTGKRGREENQGGTY